jgi:hypothetical protein
MFFCSNPHAMWSWQRDMVEDRIKAVRVLGITELPELALCFSGSFFSNPFAEVLRARPV